MTDKIITRPATDEFRQGWDRIFGNRMLTPAQCPSLNEIEQAMADADVGERVIVRDAYGAKLGIVVTEDDDYNRKLAKGLFRASRAQYPVAPKLATNPLLTPQELDESFERGIDEFCRQYKGSQ